MRAALIGTAVVLLLCFAVVSAVVWDAVGDHGSAMGVILAMDAVTTVTWGYGCLCGRLQWPQ